MKLIKYNGSQPSLPFCCLESPVRERFPPRPSPLALKRMPNKGWLPVSNRIGTRIGRNTSVTPTGFLRGRKDYHGHKAKAIEELKKAGDLYRHETHEGRGYGVKDKMAR